MRVALRVWLWAKVVGVERAERAPEPAGRRRGRSEASIVSFVRGGGGGGEGGGGGGEVGLLPERSEVSKSAVEINFYRFTILTSNLPRSSPTTSTPTSPPLEPPRWQNKPRAIKLSNSSLVRAPLLPHPPSVPPSDPKV